MELIQARTALRAHRVFVANADCRHKACLLARLLKFLQKLILFSVTLIDARPIREYLAMELNVGHLQNQKIRLAEIFIYGLSRCEILLERIKGRTWCPCGRDATPFPTPRDQKEEGAK
jgi:hypothetical protein